MPAKSELLIALKQMQVDKSAVNSDLILDGRPAVLLNIAEDYHYYTGDEHLFIDPDDPPSDRLAETQAWLKQRFSNR